MRHLSFLFLFTFLFALTACTRQLVVRTDFFTQENLASYHINTPDPNLHRPLIDQRLIITWNLSKNTCTFKEKVIRLKVRLRNRVEEDVEYPINHKEGFALYQIGEEKFRETGGIQTYKVELWGDDTIIDEWLHPLWVELIKFKHPPKTNEESKAFSDK